MVEFIQQYIVFDYWLILGFIGQGFFFLRFLVQWVHSERHQESRIPIHFWYLSIVGAVLVFIYAIRRGDPVFFIGQGFAVLVYLRNIQFMKRTAAKNKMNGNKDLYASNE